MGLDELLARLTSNPVTPVTSEENQPLHRKPSPLLVRTAATSVAAEKVSTEIVNLTPGLSVEPTTPSPAWSQVNSYPCGKCGGLHYTQVQGGWQCDGCNVFFEIIGGRRGPEIIH